MDKQKHLYWAFQSSQTLAPTEKQLELFQRKYKENFEQRTVYEGEELLDKYQLNGWRNALFSNITSIIVAFEHEGTLRVKHIEGSEKDLLQNFVNLLRNSFQDYKLVHFDAEVVLPYIGVRLNKNGHVNTPHQDLKYFGLRSWNFTGVDLKAFYQGGGRYSYSLEEIAYILNIDCEGIIPYEDEVTYFSNGDFESLNISAVKKVETLSKIHRKLFELPELETVLIKETVENIEEQKPTNWLFELEKTNQLTLEIAQGLREQIISAKKKPTKKEKEVLFETIRAVYVKTDFEHNNQDSKKTIESKEKEITNLINSL